MNYLNQLSLHKQKEKISSSSNYLQYKSWCKLPQTLLLNTQCVIRNRKSNSISQITFKRIHNYNLFLRRRPGWTPPPKKKPVNKEMQRKDKITLQQAFHLKFLTGWELNILYPRLYKREDKLTQNVADYVQSSCSQAFLNYGILSV